MPLVKTVRAVVIESKQKSFQDREGTPISGFNIAVLCEPDASGNSEILRMWAGLKFAEELKEHTVKGFEQKLSKQFTFSVRQFNNEEKKTLMEVK